MFHGRGKLTGSKYKISNKRFHSFFEKETRLLFILAFVFYLLGLSLDILFNMYRFGKEMVIIDAFSIAVLFVIFILGIKGHISIQTAYAIFIYSATIGMGVLYVYQITNDIFNPFILFQDMLAIPLTIVSMGLIISKRHLLITAGLLSIVYPGIMLFSGNKELINSALFVLILIIGPAIAFFIILNAIENSLVEREKIRTEIENQKEDLKQLIEEKNKVLSLIAHDLKNPIGNVLNILDLIKDMPYTDSEREELISTAYKSQQKSVELLNNLLEWSTNEQGLFKFNPNNINLHNLVNEIVDSFNNIAREKNITVLNQIPPEMMSFSDKIMIATIFRNLISNAIKFCHENGKVTIDADYYENNILISVSDTGVGIEEKKLETLFSEDLNQSSKGTKDEKGFGLGLILVKDFVEKNGGKIWATSERGKGSTFYFTVPLSSV